MKAVIVNLVKQFIDIVWNGKKFEPTQLCEAVFDGIMSGVLDKLSIKSPKSIRDIKAKARSKGIKGTKKLVQYLTKQKIKVSIWNLGLEALKDFCYNVVKNIISTIMNTLQEIVNDIISVFVYKISPSIQMVDIYITGSYDNIRISSHNSRCDGHQKRFVYHGIR